MSPLFCTVRPPQEGPPATQCSEPGSPQRRRAASTASPAAPSAQFPPSSPFFISRFRFPVSCFPFASSSRKRRRPGQARTSSHDEENGKQETGNRKPVIGSLRYFHSGQGGRSRHASGSRFALSSDSCSLPRTRAAAARQLCTPSTTAALAAQARDAHDGARVSFRPAPAPRRQGRLRHHGSNFLTGSEG